MSVQILQEPARTGRSLRDAVFPDMRTSALSACVSTVAGWIVRSGQRRPLESLLTKGGCSATWVSPVLRGAAKPFWHR
jgi:hypothetical protein